MKEHGALPVAAPDFRRLVLDSISSLSLGTRGCEDRTESEQACSQSQSCTAHCQPLMVKYLEALPPRCGFKCKAAAMSGESLLKINRLSPNLL